jgi:hypothetical protein
MLADIVGVLVVLSIAIPVAHALEAFRSAGLSRSPFSPEESVAGAAGCRLGK